MWEDPIVAEVRKIREEYAARFDYDLRALYQALKEQQDKDTRLKASFGPTAAERLCRVKKLAE